jgi:hypothetical protein
MHIEKHHESKVHVTLVVAMEESRTALLSLIAYTSGKLWRRLVLPRKIEN